MKRIYRTAITVSATLLPVSAAQAHVTPNSVRVVAKDSVGLGKFYQGFGATIESAKANKGEPIVIMHRDSDDKNPASNRIEMSQRP